MALRVSKAVLDASALMAVIQSERGSELVEPVLYGAIISAVSVGEVYKKFAERKGDVERVRHMVASTMLRIIPFDEQRAFAAARLWHDTSDYGLSFADRACLATGVEFSLPVLTTDALMARPRIGVTVTLIRPRLS